MSLFQKTMKRLHINGSLMDARIFNEMGSHGKHQPAYKQKKETIKSEHAIKTSEVTNQGRYPIVLVTNSRIENSLKMDQSHFLKSHVIRNCRQEYRPDSGKYFKHNPLRM